MNPYASMKQAYTESAVMTATPERLVVMLYDGAIRFLNQSAAAMRSGMRQEARNRMRRAEAIIDELNLTLDMEQGEISLRLRSIYLFCKRTLTEATVEQSDAKIASVIDLLAELRESWEQLAVSSATERESQLAGIAATA
jgi:flagellar protein FliS